MQAKRGGAKGYLSTHNELSPNTMRRGNLAYQERQQRRRSYLEKKRTLRRVFELGKLVEKVGLEAEDITVIYGLLLDAKEQLLKLRCGKHPPRVANQKQHDSQ